MWSVNWTPWTRYWRLNCRHDLGPAHLKYLKEIFPIYGRGVYGHALICFDALYYGPGKQPYRCTAGNWNRKINAHCNSNFKKRKRPAFFNLHGLFGSGGQFGLGSPKTWRKSYPVPHRSSSTATHRIPMNGIPGNGGGSSGDCWMQKDWIACTAGHSMGGESSQWTGPDYPDCREETDL